MPRLYGTDYGSQETDRRRACRPVSPLSRTTRASTRGRRCDRSDRRSSIVVCAALRPVRLRVPRRSPARSTIELLFAGALGLHVRSGWVQALLDELLAHPDPTILVAEHGRTRVRFVVRAGEQGGGDQQQGQSVQNVSPNQSCGEYTGPYILSKPRRCDQSGDSGNTSGTRTTVIPRAISCNGTPSLRKSPKRY